MGDYCSVTQAGLFCSYQTTMIPILLQKGHKQNGFYDPSLLETLSCGFITSGNSGGVDRGAITTGSNSPSKTRIQN